MIDTRVVTYDMYKYKFQDKIQKIFNDFPLSLEALHKFSELRSPVTFENDTKTLFQRHFYESSLYTEFRNVYYSFVLNEISKLFPDEEYLVVQKDPQFRVHVPNNTALGVKLTDENNMIGLHCDADYNHPPEEVNYIIPITDMWETNSVFIESEPNKGDFNPIKLYRNQFIQFWGNKLRHFNKVNTTGLTRVSLDIRVIPFSKYKDNYEKQSIHGNRSFKIDDYYIKLKINENNNNCNGCE